MLDRLEATKMKEAPSVICFRDHMVPYLLFVSCTLVRKHRSFYRDSYTGEFESISKYNLRLLPATVVVHAFGLILPFLLIIRNRLWSGRRYPPSPVLGTHLVLGLLSELRWGSASNTCAAEMPDFTITTALDLHVNEVHARTSMRGLFHYLGWD